MITASQIRDGKAYISVHLSANDYYSEGESVSGHWMGRGAARLELVGEVTDEQCQALCANLHPSTGEKLTPRKRLVSFDDTVVSAPKSYSVMAMVGGDDRLVHAFREAVEKTFGELEKHAAVRVRHGEFANTEAHRITGNAVCAVYHHDTSRLLDPQLHSHLLFANLSYDQEREKWLALQPRIMLEESKRYIRDFFYKELGQKAEALGYEIEWEGKGFRLKGVCRELERKFSQRAIQREKFEQRYRELFGRDPSKARVEKFIKEGKSAARARFQKEFQAEFRRQPSAEEIDRFVKDWRSSKMKTSSRDKVWMLQQSRLTTEEKAGLGRLLERTGGVREAVSSELEIVDGEKETVEHSAGEKEGAACAEQRADSSRKLAKGEEDEPKRITREQKKAAEKRVRVGRMEAYRRYRRGRELGAMLRGYPGLFFARQIRGLARRSA